MTFFKQKGTWKRFCNLILQANVPWVWLLIYVVLSLGLVNTGISETEYTARLLDGDVRVKLITQLVVIMLINWAGDALTVVLRGITSAKMDRNLRKSLWRKILTLPLSYFQKETPKQLTSRITTDTTSFDAFFMMVLVPLLTELYTVYQILKTVADYDVRLMLTLVIIAPLVVIITNVMGRLFFTTNDKLAGIRAILTMRLSEIITNLLLVRVFVQEKKENKNANEVSNDLYKMELRSDWIDQIGGFCINLVTLIQMIVILLLGRALIQGGQITTEMWIAFFLFAGKISDNMQGLIAVWKNTKMIQGTTVEIAEIMAQDGECEIGKDASQLSGDIQVDHIQFSYDEKPVLHDLSCSFPQGKVTAVIGPSGSGKSTLFLLLSRLYEPQQGTIRIQGNSISEYALNPYRRCFAVLSQKPVLFSGTVEENLCYGLAEYPSFEKIKQALERANASFVFQMKDGLQTMIGELGNTLSGGQQQRLSIARALLSDAPYWLLDEAFSALDTAATSDILKVLQQEKNNRTLIFITHSPVILPMAEHVVVLEHGTVTCEGPKDKLRSTNQYYRDFEAEGGRQPC